MQTIKFKTLVKTLPKYNLRIANCLQNYYAHGEEIDLDAVRAAVVDGSILEVRNFGHKCHAVLVAWLKINPARSKETARPRN
jgi:hypothetical protein